MKPDHVQQVLATYIAENGGYEKRHYLDMSQLCNPNTTLAKRLRCGTPPPDQTMAQERAIGCDVEQIMLEKLVRCGLVKPDSSRHLVADFDMRLQGHTDAEMMDGSLCEIKSVLEQNIRDIENEGRIGLRHNAQVQTHMHFGNYERCYVVYVARDTGRVLVKHVNYSLRDASYYVQKAKDVLTMLDSEGDDNRI